MGKEVRKEERQKKGRRIDRKGGEKKLEGMKEVERGKER